MLVWTFVRFYSELTGLLCHYSKHVQCSLDENLIPPSFSLHRGGAGDCRLYSVGIIAIDMESSIIASDVLENDGKSTFYPAHSILFKKIRLDIFPQLLCAVSFFWSFSLGCTAAGCQNMCHDPGWYLNLQVRYSFKVYLFFSEFNCSALAFSVSMVKGCKVKK